MLVMRVPWVFEDDKPKPKPPAPAVQSAPPPRWRIPGPRAVLWMLLFTSALILLGFGLAVGSDLHYETSEGNGVTTTGYVGAGKLIAGLVVLLCGWAIQTYPALMLMAHRRRYPSWDGSFLLNGVVALIAGLLVVTPLLTLYQLVAFKEEKKEDTIAEDQA